MALASGVFVIVFSMGEIVLEKLVHTRIFCMFTIKSCIYSQYMSINKRIKERRLALGLTSHKALADLVGVTWQTVQQWEKDGGTAPNRSRIDAVAAALGVSAEWLRTGTRSGNLGTIEPAGYAGAEFDKNVSPAFGGIKPIPVLSAIQAGAMKEITEPYPVGQGQSTIYVDADYSRWAFGLVIEGDSMLPDFLPGDVVIIEPEWDPRPGEYVAAKNGHDEATFKKYRQRGVDSNGNVVFELIPLNEDYPTLRSDATPLIIVGVMAEHRRKTRRR